MQDARGHADHDGQEREEHQGNPAHRDAARERARIARAESLLQQAWRQEERRRQQDHREPADVSACPEARVCAGLEAAAGVLARHRRRDQKADQNHRQLHLVHDGGALQAAQDEVPHGKDRRNEAPTS